MQKVYYLWFHHVRIAEVIKLELLERYQTPKQIYEMKEYPGVAPQIVQKLNEAKAYLDWAKAEYERCEKAHITLVAITDEKYPKLLKNIPDAPIMLYVKGNVDVLNTPTFAIVGARDCLEYGYELTIKIADELASSGITVVSGMAKGIDGAAHEGALRSGQTIAVLGTSVDVCYPACNRNLYNQIPKQGAIVSEYPLNTLARPYQFPKRNRIISGLSWGVLVSEADYRSGSLITANLALEYNRDVFAIPGDLRRRMSLGTNELIKKGAKCVTDVKDILEELPSEIRAKLTRANKNTLKNHNNELAQEERMVYAYVSWNPIFLNELLTSTKLSYKAIYRDLTQLELKGYIRKLPGERYVRS